MQNDRLSRTERILRFPPAQAEFAEVRHSAPPELLPRTLVRRKRLIQLLEEPFQASVTQVIAGAGYGKTAFIADWAAQTTQPVCWIRLNASDNVPRRLLSRLHDAIRELGGKPPVTDGRNPAASGIDAARIAFLEATAGIETPACLVLDDCHVLTDVDAVQPLNDLIATLPAPFHLILIGRSRLGLHLGRLRVMGQVREISQKDLRFSEQEISKVLHFEAGVEPDPNLLQFVAQADGWATGIFLAALLLSEDGLPAEWDREAVHNAYLDEYVQQEVLGPHDDDLQAFVLATVALPFLTPELCDAVLDRIDGAAMLAVLRNDLAFVAPVRDAPDRLIYNPLIAQSLRRISERATDTALRGGRNAKAARWLLDANEPKLAGALATASGDTDLIGEIAEQVGEAFAVRSDVDALLAWLTPLPEAVFEGRPHLQYWRIAARLLIGRAIGADAMLNAVEPAWLASGDPLFVGRAALCRGELAYHAGNDADAMGLLNRALETLPENAAVERLHAVTFLGRAAFRQGEDQHSSAVLAQAPEFTISLPLDEQWSWRALGADRGNAYALRGDLNSASTKYRLLLSELPPALASLEGFYRCRLISLAIERHELDTAIQEFTRIEEIMGDEPASWHHDAALARVRLLIAQGRRDEAEAWGANYIKVLRRLPEKNQLVLLLAQLWLERRELSLVRSWLDDIDASEEPWVRVFGDVNHRVLALSLLLVDEDFERAAHNSSRMLAEAQVTLRWSESIGLSMRLAVALHCLGRIDEAKRAAREAIDRGVKGGFVRAFHVPHFDTATLFAPVWSESTEYLRAKRQLQSYQDGAAHAGASLLTRREIELLSLVALGRSNQQIAGDLFISVNTVRNHLVKICRRLNATSRLEAVSRARDLGVID